MAIDYESPVGQVRLLIADTNETSPVLDDAQVGGFLALNAASVRLAAADALDAIADSETLVSKAIKTQDLTTDGPKVAASLRSHADRLRKQVKDQAEDDDLCFDVVDFDPHPWPELTEHPIVNGL